MSAGKSWATYMSPTGTLPEARRLAAAHRANEVLGVATCADCYGPCHEDEGYTFNGELVCQACHHEAIFYDQYEGGE